MRALLNWCGALVGLLLILAGGLLQPTVPWWTAETGAGLRDLPITAQVPAVLLTALVCGPRAGLLASVAYLTLGLVLLPVFQDGGGFDYLLQPSFGFLAGFIPAAWFCGRLARQPGMNTLERLFGTAVLGLLLIHLSGVLNLLLGALVHRWSESLPQLVLTYSLLALPGQLLMCAVVALLARLLRPLLLIER
ncbi:MAG: biotin transporter BioY [Prochlorococcaceae cyanobacterium]